MAAPHNRFRALASAVATAPGDTARDRWIPELGDADLDPHLLLWDMHRNVTFDQIQVI
jgi:hypothetical protein